MICGNKSKLYEFWYSNDYESSKDATTSSIAILETRVRLKFHTRKCFFSSKLSDEDDVDFYMLRELIKNAFRPDDDPDESFIKPKILQIPHCDSEAIESLTTAEKLRNADMLGWQSTSWEWQRLES
jgi:hypothetical protein